MENKTEPKRAGMSESRQGYFEEELYCSGNSPLQSTLCDKKLEEIKSGYGDSEVCMGEMLASVPAGGGGCRRTDGHWKKRSTCTYGPCNGLRETAFSAGYMTGRKNVSEVNYI